MLANNSTRIGRLPLGAGTLDNHHHHQHNHHRRHISTHSTTTTNSSLSSSSTTTTKTTSTNPSSPTLKQRHHRSCQSSCHSSSSSSSHSQVSNNNCGLELGQKVTVSSANTLGTIRFIGITSFKPGTWVGIELDTVGTGKNDGTINGVRYFDCPPETGLFILAKRVTPLKQSTLTTSTKPAPKKSLTTITTQRHRTKTPSMDPLSPAARTQSLHSRQRCLSHEHHQHKPSTAVLSVPPKRKPLTASLSTLPSRPQSRTDTSTTIGHKVSSAPLSSLTGHKHPLSTTRKSATPAILSPSPPSNIKHQHNKSTRRTVTPTTNHTKKRNASLTSSTITTTIKQPLHGPAAPRKSKSTSTRQVVTQDELKKMHVLLEQSRQEKQRLSDEMNGKEAVWERLVTAKESYALKVEDMQKQVSQLQDALQQSQQQVAHLESQLSQHTSASLPNSPPGSGDTAGDGMHGVNIMEQQYIQRIEKLDRLVREWQQDAQDSHQQVQHQQRTYAAQIEQLRRDLADRDQATAIMEREYEAAKQTNLDTIRQYESTMMQWTAERDSAMAYKDNHISRLEHMVNELKACHFLLPPSPNNEEEEDDEDRLFDIGYDNSTTGITDLDDVTRANTKAAAIFSAGSAYGNNPTDNNTSTNTNTNTNSNNSNSNSSTSVHSSRRRLEQQLELTTIALEDVQQKHKASIQENEQLREQLAHMHAASGAADQQFRQLQRELSDEINDKRKVMEERDVALQSQLRAEDNYKDLVMTNTRLEQQLEQRQNTHEKLLVVENKFVQLQHQHSLLLQQTHNATKKQQQQQQQPGEQYKKGGFGDMEDPSLQQYRKETGRNQQQQHKNDNNDDQKNPNITHVQQVIADMTLALKKKSIRIAELEKDLYQAEQRSMQSFYSLDSQQQRQRPYHHNASSMGMTSFACSGIIMPISPISDSPSPVIAHSSLPPSRTHSRSGHNTSFGEMALMASMNNEKTLISQGSSIYCVNCEISDDHTTSDCPTQDETY